MKKASRGAIAAATLLALTACGKSADVTACETIKNDFESFNVALGLGEPEVLHSTASNIQQSLGAAIDKAEDGELVSLMTSMRSAGWAAAEGEDPGFGYFHGMGSIEERCTEEFGVEIEGPDL